MRDLVRPPSIRKRLRKLLLEPIDFASLRALLLTVLLAMIAVAACAVSIAIAPGAVGLCGAGLALIVIAIAVTDWRSYIIPDWLSAAGLALAFVHAGLRNPDMVGSAVATAAVRGAVLALIFLAIRSLYSRLRAREGMGLGDVKLAGVGGAWLGIAAIPVAIELAVLAALSGYLLRQVVYRQPMSVTARLPFGFFFAPAIWAGWVLEETWLAPT